MSPDAARHCQRKCERRDRAQPSSAIRRGSLELVYKLLRLLHEVWVQDRQLVVICVLVSGADSLQIFYELVAEHVYDVVKALLFSRILL